MNQVHQNQTFKSTPEKPAFKPDQTQRVRLTQGDMQALHATLIKGDAALAQRKDLGELYKRIVTMISTLDTGLSERQEAQGKSTHKLLSTRLDSMERTINQVEGALRIEMEPMLRTTVNKAINDRLVQNAGRRRTSIGRRMVQVSILLISIYIGSILSKEITELTTETSDYLSNLIPVIFGFLSPDGGIGSYSIPVD